MTPPSPHDLDEALRYAAGRGQIVPRFAPLARTRDGTVTGFAVHATWEHPDLGTLGPARFLPRAVRLGLAADLDRWVVEQTCESVARWGAEALDALALVVVPCSEAASQEPGFVSTARAAADVAGLPADRLVLVWPERALTPAVGEAHRLMGVGLGGTGLSFMPDPRLDAVTLGPTSVRRLLADGGRQTMTRAAARRGVAVVACGLSSPPGTLLEAGVTLVESGPARPAPEALAALTASPTHPG